MEHTKQRLHYIDVAKGLLILMVVVYHIGVYLPKEAGVENVLFMEFATFDFLYTFFFMPAFFAITGFCSNFNKPYKQFLWADFKTLFAPAILLTILCDVILYLSTGKANFYYLNTYFAIRLLSPYWFLIALFWAKQLYYWLRKIVSNRIRLFVAYLAVMCGGVWLKGKVMDYWYLESSMIYAVFIFIGQQLKQRNFQFDDWRFCVVPYVLLVGGLRLFSIEIPSLYNGQLRIETFPLNLIGAVVGTIMILYVARKIANSRCLEYLGRHSLTIYCLHFTFIRIFGTIFKNDLNMMDMRMSVVALIALLTFVIGACVAFSWLLNRKCLKWMIGKW